MEIVKVSEGFSNAYLVISNDRKALIDTGTRGDREIIMDRIAGRGIGMDEIDYIFLTHGHVDHIGNAAFFQKTFGIKIIMAEGDVDLIENPTAQPFTFAKGLIGRAIKWGSERSLGKNPIEDFTPDAIISKGDLSSYWMGEEIHFIPGHTRGSIGILFSDGSFISGDTFFNIMRPSIALMGTNREALDNSLRYLKTLPIKVVYPGHGGPIQVKKTPVKGFNK